MLEYPPSRTTMASLGQSGLYPNVSSAPPRHHTTESTNRRPDFEPPLSATIVAKQPRQNYQPTPPLPRSDRQPQQPNPPLHLELLPCAAPRPFQPSHPLPVTTPFAASNLQPQAIIPSSMKEERETNIQEGEERMEIEDIIIEYKSAIETAKPDSDGSITSCPSFVRVRLPSRDQVGVEEELLDDGPPQSAPILQLCNPNSSKEEEGSIGEVKVIVSFNVARESPHDVQNCWGKEGGGEYTVFHEIACIYKDLNVGDVTSMKQRSTSLDTDARLIPPRNNTPCVSIQECVAELFVLALNLDDHISLPSLIFYGGDKGRHPAVRYVFDPGEEASPKLLLSTFIVAPWFSP